MDPMAKKILAHPVFSTFTFHPLAGQIVDGCQYLWDGSKLTVPWATEESMEVIRDIKGLPEPIEADQFVKLVRQLGCEDLTMYEIGAGGGIYSLYASKVCPSVKLVLVEPSDFLYEVTKKNMVLNALDGQAITVHAAVSEQSGEVVMLSDDMHGSSIVGGIGRFPVLTVTIDKLIRHFQESRVDILHMDVQGAELKALQGCRQSFRQGIIRNIFVATHSDELHQQCLEFLKEQNFEIMFSQPMSEVEVSYDGLIIAKLARLKPGLLDPLVGLWRSAVSNRGRAEA